MTTALISHRACLNHRTPEGHPEQVARLQVVTEALADDRFSALFRLDAPICADTDILLAHPQSHLDAIRNAAPATGTVRLDGDTYMSSGSLEAAQRGVGANIMAVDSVMLGVANNAFCAIRPPGHHAETATPMGFCLFGNVAIAAKHALENHGLERVAIVDFDVHHGNGTQDLVWNDSRIFFASTHEMPLYPGSGAVTETGAHNNVLNVPLPAGADGSLFREQMTDIVLPALDDFAPQLVLVSAGFDAHRADPLANLELEVSDFEWVTHAICDIADKHCEGRVVSTLEGGYDLEALAASVAAHVAVLMERGRGG